MSHLGLPCPEPPDFVLDWAEIEARFDWIRAMARCPQDPLHHGEGDVLNHTRAVVEALLGLDAFRARGGLDREVLFAAALLHDVAKPLTSREELGRITARGHSGRGEVLARRILWGLDAPLRPREQVCQLVRFHELPFFLVGLDDAESRALHLSQVASPALLALLAEADALGRESDSKGQMRDAVGLFRDYCLELGCLEEPYPFGSDQARFEYFRKPGRDPRHVPHEPESRSEVILLSGLAGVGKDHWAAEHAEGWPMISLDALREELEAPPSGHQGVVVQAAKARAREHLRAKRRFLWNATNLSRKIRRQVIDLCADYGARVGVVALEVPEALLREQNRARPAAVPEAALARMLERWQVPDRTEGTWVTWKGEPAGWWPL